MSSNLTSSVRLLNLTDVAIAYADLKVHNVREALQRLSEWKPDVLIGDIGIPSEDRYDLIRTIRASGCDAPAHQPTELCRLIATLISRDK